MAMSFEQARATVSRAAELTGQCPIMVRGIANRLDEIENMLKAVIASGYQPVEIGHARGTTVSIKQDLDHITGRLVVLKMRFEAMSK